MFVSTSVQNPNTASRQARSIHLRREKISAWTTEARDRTIASQTTESSKTASNTVVGADRTANMLGRTASNNRTAIADALRNEPRFMASGGSVHVLLGESQNVLGLLGSKAVPHSGQRLAGRPTSRYWHRRQ
jgi:hypothetical protein